MTYTPGPWNYVGSSVYLPTSNLKVAKACEWTETEAVPDLQTAEANARLIAAAPDMLAALKAVRAYHNGGREYSMEAIDAAIAKAEDR